MVKGNMVEKNIEKGYKAKKNTSIKDSRTQDTSIENNLTKDSTTQDNPTENSSTKENPPEDAQKEVNNCCCHTKATPRQNQELKQLKNRLNRMMGQLNGISRMLDENRYCGDILTQVAAVESALQSFGYVILKEHMETCVVEEISKGNEQIMEEALELIKKLK